MQKIDPVRVAAGLLIVLAGLAVVERVSPKLAGWYVAAVLLGVVLMNRAGFDAFAAFILARTQGI